MSSTHPLRLLPALCLILALSPKVSGQSAPVQSGYLKGKVEQKNVAQPTRPPKIHEGGDPFSSSDNAGDPFGSEAQPPAPAKGVVTSDDRFASTAPPPPPAPTDGSAADQTPDMQLAWDAWHERIAAVLFNRFNFMAKAAFQYSPPLACRVSYTVTRDGQVKDIKMLEPSPNIPFNLLVTAVLKSIGGDKDLLKFPEGTRRTEVEKSGTFTQNYGVEGFKYTTGDKEAVRAKGVR
ncbi:MAG: TonB C-terminal domain-containing protein [Acidobacteriales bacterium]|nr:TonB C-terminal domain-containing protein [Terriglobales bacterium]